MDSSLDWLKRDNPAYDPNRIGAISHAKVLAALVAAVKFVLAPCVQVMAYDLMIDEGDRFYRVQCKTGRLFRGAVRFYPYRLRAAKRETGWQRQVRDYEGDVDLFGVYCPELGSVYLVPIAVVGRRRHCMLRMSPAKNNQSKGIRWARDYLVVAQEIPEPKLVVRL